MPELPEVETIVSDLKKKVLDRTFLSVWTDFKKTIKKPENFEEFKKNINGRKIKNIKRRGKNILFELSDNKTLLIHQKLTGHLLLGRWRLEGKKWEPLIKGPLNETVNKFIHLMFYLNGDLMLALSDLRKFAKVELWDSEELKKSEEINKLGPEPLEKKFTLKKFQEALNKKNGKIKQVLMDQSVIAGIGNIYSDEILWEARINPLKKTKKINKEEMKKIYIAMKKILKKAIRLRGDSMSDYRRISGAKGGYQKIQKAYHQEGKKCIRCGTIIKRIKLGGRSANFCPKCQSFK